MKIEYRLMQIIESWDRTIGQNVEIFEFAQIKYTDDGSQYSFNRTPNSEENHFFVFLASENRMEEFEAQRFEIIELNLNEFHFEIMHPPEGRRKTFFSKKLYALRTGNKYNR